MARAYTNGLRKTKGPFVIHFFSSEMFLSKIAIMKRKVVGAVENLVMIFDFLFFQTMYHQAFFKFENAALCW